MTTANLTTYGAYVQAASGQKMNEEQAEAFGRDVSKIIFIMVMDSGFSPDAKRSLPKVKGDYSSPNLNAWLAEMEEWIDGLSKADHALFLQLTFIP